MNAVDTHQGALLAATELLPADWRDLSEVLEEAGGVESLLLRSGVPANSRESIFAVWLQMNWDLARAEYWTQVLEQLSVDMPRVRLVLVTDDDYPRLLKECWDRPPFLFVDGEIAPADRATLAIVGSRAASDAALQAARHVATEAAGSEVTVVSGLAQGVDTAAHEAAIDAGGKTIAVIGSGIDFDHKHAARELSRRIGENGAVVSQFRPGSPPTRSSYPLRNSVISGLSAASLIVEAGAKSGTRTEAEHALRQGRPVLMWKPIMTNHAWAHDLVRHPLVSFVDSYEEICALMAELH